MNDQKGYHPKWEWTMFIILGWQMMKKGIQKRSCHPYKGVRESGGIIEVNISISNIDSTRTNNLINSHDTELQNMVECMASF